MIQVISPDNVVIGRIVPQQYWEHSELMKCAAKIANFCPSRGIIGNLTVEVIVWKDAESVNSCPVED